jgi:hypothetical protein
VLNSDCLCGSLSKCGPSPLSGALGLAKLLGLADAEDGDLDGKSEVGTACTDALDEAFPFDDYDGEKASIREFVALLEREYDEREKVIKRIMKYGTGIETEKALRVCPIAVLERWESSLRESRAADA